MAAGRPKGWVIGSVAGIDLRLHPTFLFLVGAAAVGLLGPPVDALLWLLLVFGSVVLHELGHSLVARRRGVVVRDIVLLPIGGMSEFDRLPVSPRAQAAVAAAGPLTSLGIAATAAVLALASGDAVWQPELVGGGVLHDVAWLNLVLGGFNLLPALPLDGGRLLRARFAGRMSADEATVRAARIGRYLAWALIVVGSVADLWLLVIGVFVLVVGQAEAAVAATRLEVGDLLVAELARPPVGVEPGTGLRVHGSDRIGDVLDDLAAEGGATVLDEHQHVVGRLELEDVLARARHVAER